MRSARSGDGGGAGEDELLAVVLPHRARSCRPRKLSRSIAFPAISTGIYRFPPDRAARIAVGTVVAELAGRPRGIGQGRVLLLCAMPADHHVAAFAELGLA